MSDKGISSKEDYHFDSSQAIAAVEKDCDFLVGMVVLRKISSVMMPPSISIPCSTAICDDI